MFDVNFLPWPAKSVNPNLSNINLIKQKQIYLLLGNTIKNCWKNRYLQPKSFKSTFKTNSYLMSISRRDPLNPSTPIFGNISLIETMTNLVVAWKFNQKWLNESLFATKSFETALKSNSYLTSIFRHGPVNPSNTTFPNTNPTKTMINWLFVSIIAKIWLQ